MKQWGLYLIVIGLGSFVLPFLGLQFGLINIFGEENQTLAALGITGLGAILYVVGSIRERVAPGGAAAPSVAVPEEQEFAASSGVAQEPISQASEQRCPQCGTPVRPGDRFCRDCGAPAPEPGCPQCGTPARPGERFCKNCGADLNAAAAGRPQAARRPVASPSQAPASSSNRGLWVFVAIVALALVAYLSWDSISARLSGSRATITPTPIVRPRDTLDAGQTVFSEITSVWLEHNVPFGDLNYLAIHTAFQVNRSDASQVWVKALFYEADNTPMITLSDDYSVGGQIGVQESAVLGDGPVSYWDDFVLYVPNNVLPVGVGHYASVEVWNADSTEILGWADTESFDVNP